MTRLIDRPYDPTRPLVARRFFVAAGRHFSPGDLFDRRKVLCTPRRVRQLFDAGKLTHPDVSPVATPVAQTPPKQEAQGTNAHSLAAPAAVADQQPAPAEQVIDDLTDLTMKDLRVIAAAEDAPTRTSRADQRTAIRDNRAERAAAQG